MDQEKREAYEAPLVIDYGSVSELTNAGNEPNADAPGGPNNTAFSPA